MDGIQSSNMSSYSASGSAHACILKQKSAVSPKSCLTPYLVSRICTTDSFPDKSLGILPFIAPYLKGVISFFMREREECVSVSECECVCVCVGASVNVCL